MPYPVLFINDNPEGHLLTLIYDSAQTPFPCRMCDINGNYLAQPQDFHRGHMRNMHDTHEFVAQKAEIINAGERGTVTTARATLKAKSLHSQKSGSART